MHWSVKKSNSSIIRHRKPPNTLEVVSRFRQFGPVVDYSEGIIAASEPIRGDRTIEDVLCSLNGIAQQFMAREDPVAAPKTLLESRMTPASQVLQRGMVSCGAVATLCAALLRSSGRPVKLVHGVYRDSDHAWLEVWDDSGRKWLSFDPMESTVPVGKLAAGHVKLAECADWSEIYGILLEAQKKYELLGA